MPDSASLQARLDATQARLEQIKLGAKTGDWNDATRNVRNAERELAEGIKRDALQGTRPDGCWCLGLGGKRERFTYSGAIQYEEYCSCAEGVEVKTTHARDAEVADAEREAKRIKAGWDGAELPKRFRSYRLRTSPLTQSKPELVKMLTYPQLPGDDASEGEISTWAEAERNWLRSWFLFGPYGTGKSGLAVGYAGEYLKHYADTIGSTWAPILFKPVPDLFSELRDTYNGKGESEQDVIKKFVAVPLLILDDLGAEHVKDSGWLEDRLYQIIGKRHGEELTTVFTSNLSLEKLAAKIGERVTWRIVEMCGADHIIQVDGTNLRDR